MVDELTKTDKLIKADKSKAGARLPDEGELIEIGQWYWVKDEKEGDWIGCIVHVGSNFVSVEGVDQSSQRFHLEGEFEKHCTRELDPRSYFQGKVNHYRKIVQEKLEKIKDITARLGIVPKEAIEHTTVHSRALSTLSGTDNVKNYKKSLIKAKDKDLPKLFGEVKEANSSIAMWLKAETIPMKASVEGLKEVVGEINDRIFNVSIYAGLTEIVRRVAEGEPASADEKLHIMQRRLYMDEECLMDYRHGGMEFRNIKKFDEWMAKPSNRDRLLPFPRCMAAFRVRRSDKQRTWDGTMMGVFILMNLKQADTLTYMYIRNGDQLYRMDCDLEFDSLIFPGRHEVDLSGPMMFRTSSFSDVEEIIPVREYDDKLKEHNARKRKEQEWKKKHRGKSSVHNPHSMWGEDSRMENWHPFNKSSVYYDEAKETIAKRVKYYNRIALIVQGLYDRSPVLNPHPPYQIWKPEGFGQAVKLVYDGTETIHYGEAPDFERYRLKGLSALKAGVITIGQDDYWAQKEAEKENARRDRSWRETRSYRHERYRPSGNPGPGYIAKIQEWQKRKRMATYKWIRERQSSDYYGGKRYGDPIPAKVAVPVARLFNVDAYTLGDFKQFFVDPRTRAQYLKWAPLLLAAEEYKVGNVKVEEEGISLRKVIKRKQ